MFTALLYVCWSSAFVFGTLFAIQSHAYTLTNLHGFIFLAVVFLFKQRLTKDDRTILLLIIVGLFLMVLDPWSYRIDKIKTDQFGRKFKTKTIVVDCLLILSNLVTAAFFMFNRVLLNSENKFKYFMLLNVFIMISTCLIAVILEGARLDTHPTQGLFGWVNKQACMWNLFMDGVVATILGQFGPIVCMQYYSPVYCLNLFLFEPLIAQFFGLICGIDSIPSLMTIGGYCCISYSLWKINMRDSMNAIEKENILPPEFKIPIVNEEDMDEEQIMEHIRMIENKVNNLRKDYNSIYLQKSQKSSAKVHGLFSK